MSRSVSLALAALLILGVLFAAWKLLQSPQPVGEPALSNEQIAPGDHVLGRADAPVTIIEYASLTCPHCAEFHEKGLTQIQKNYIDTGKAKLVFRGLTLNPLDTSAQMITHCIADEQYFPFISAIYVTQKSWVQASDPLVALLQVSKQAGFTKDSFEKCLRNQKALDEINNVRKAFEKKVGPATTPTFIVNGKVLPPQNSFEAQLSGLEKLILSQVKP